MWRRERLFSEVVNARSEGHGGLLAGNAGGRLVRTIALWLFIALALTLVFAFAGCGPATNERGAGSQNTAPKASAVAPSSPPRSAPAPGSGPLPKAPASAPKTQPKPPVAPVKKVVAAPAVAAASGPRIAFSAIEADFGDIQFGDLVQYAFDFKNVGKENLVVSNVQIETLEGC